MSFNIYNSILDLTSKWLNYYVKRKNWNRCHKILEFRKNKIAPNLRVIVKNK